MAGGIRVHSTTGRGLWAGGGYRIFFAGGDIKSDTVRTGSNANLSIICPFRPRSNSLGRAKNTEIYRDIENYEEVGGATTHTHTHTSLLMTL